MLLPNNSYVSTAIWILKMELLNILVVPKGVSYNSIKKVAYMITYSGKSLRQFSRSSNTTSFCILKQKKDLKHNEIHMYTPHIGLLTAQVISANNRLTPIHQ